MIEEISGPGTQSLLRMRADLEGFTGEDVKHFTGNDELLKFQPSELIPGAWVSQWADWISLKEVLELTLSPDVLAHLLQTFAGIYERHRSDEASLSWDPSFIFYQLDEDELVYQLKLDEPLMVQSKDDGAEEFFQTLLEAYLQAEDLTSEQAADWLLARDEEWPKLLEAILGRSIDPTFGASMNKDALKIKRVETVSEGNKHYRKFLPPAIPLACLTQIPPGSARLGGRDIFWIEGRCILGSSPERADYLLKSSRVLPEHCLISYKFDSYTLQTIGVGTLKLDGKTMGRNETRVLPTSCVIEIVDIKLYFFMETESDRLVA